MNAIICYISEPALPAVPCSGVILILMSYNIKKRLFMIPLSLFFFPLFLLLPRYYFFSSVQVQTFSAVFVIMPQTLEKLKGHTAFGLSVRPLQNLLRTSFEISYLTRSFVNLGLSPCVELCPF